MIDFVLTVGYNDLIKQNKINRRLVEKDGKSAKAVNICKCYLSASPTKLMTLMKAYPSYLSSVNKYIYFNITVNKHIMSQIY